MYENRPEIRYCMYTLASTTESSKASGLFGKYCLIWVRVIGERRKQQVLLYCTYKYLSTFVPSTFTLQVFVLPYLVALSHLQFLSESTWITYRIPLPGFYLQPVVLLDSRQLHPVPGLVIVTVTVTVFPSSRHSSFNATYSTDSHRTAILGICPKTQLSNPNNRRPYTLYSQQKAGGPAAKRAIP